MKKIACGLQSRLKLEEIQLLYVLVQLVFNWSREKTLNIFQDMNATKTGIITSNQQPASIPPPLKLRTLHFVPSG